MGCFECLLIARRWFNQYLLDRQQERVAFMSAARHFLVVVFLFMAWPVQGQTPITADDYLRRGAARHSQGDLDGAISDFTKAIEIDSRDADAYDRRGEARRTRGDLDGAIADSTKAIEIDPRLVDAYVTRGLARRKKGDLDGAAADYTRSIAIDPNYADGYNALAWLLSTASRDSIRDGKRALELARKAAELTRWQDASVLDTLAAAHAEVGDFEEAIKWEKKALSLPELAKSSDADRVGQRLQLYVERKRYRQQ
jgi:tetratricopeptide (TPR) repeat protein